MVRPIPVILILTFIISGCRTTSNVDLAGRSISPSEVQESILAHHSRIFSMKGEGRISIETPDAAQSGSFTLALQKPDSILINLHGPFGIKVGFALVTRKEFFFYNSLENQLITGASSAEHLERVLHIKLDFDDLLDLFSGGKFTKEDLRSPDRAEYLDDMYVLSYSYGDSSHRYWIDRETLAINKFQSIDQSGNITLEQIFDRFKDVDGIPMPHIIRVMRPGAGQKLSVNYSDIIINIEQLKFTFTIPSNAEQIHW